MTLPSVTAPRFVIDFSLAGFKKGIYKAFGPITVGVLIVTLSQYVTYLQDRIGTEQDAQIILGYSLAAAFIKFLLTWLTTTTPTSTEIA